jgi:hypothetical protein
LVARTLRRPIITLVVALPLRLATTLPSHLAPSFFKCLLAPLPLPPIVVSLPCYSIVAPCYNPLLVGIPSSLSCASGRAWSNTNKLHPVKVFFFQILDFFFFALYFVYFVCLCARLKFGPLI